VQLGKFFRILISYDVTRN